MVPAQNLGVLPTVSAYSVRRGRVLDGVRVPLKNVGNKKWRKRTIPHPGTQYAYVPDPKNDIAGAVYRPGQVGTTGGDALTHTTGLIERAMNHLSRTRLSFPSEYQTA